MNLIEAMDIDFVAAKRWTTLMFAIGALIYVASCIVIVLAPGLDRQFAVALTLAQSIAFYAKVKANERYGCGEAIRRPAMLQDALGIQPSRLGISQMSARLRLPESKLPTYLGAYYYSSQLPVGEKRLIEIIHECAFWTTNLARKTQRVMWSIIAFASIATVFVLIVCVLWATHVSRLEEMAKIVLIGADLR